MTAEVLELANEFRNPVLLNFIRIANELLLFDDSITVFGSVAHAIHTENENFDDFEMDVLSTNTAIHSFLESMGIRKVENVEEVKRRLGYSDICDPKQTFYSVEGGLVIDVSTRENNPYSTIVLSINGFRIRTLTLEQTIETYERASRREDISNEKRLNYKAMLGVLYAAATNPSTQRNY
jgi:hypothetical protein